jgi:hypothetical protein
MEAVDLGIARARLDVLKRRARETVAGAVVLALAGAAFAASGHSQLAFSFAFGAAVGLAVSYLARAERSHVLTRVVAQGDGSFVAEAEAFGRKLLAPAKRLRLARGLERAAAAGRPGVHEYTWARAERAYDLADQLHWLAAAFRDLAVPVTPVSAALCRRMLCEAAVSPLYNPRIPAAELARLLRVIGAGLDESR